MTIFLFVLLLLETGRNGTDRSCEVFEATVFYSRPKLPEAAVGPRGLLQNGI